MKPCLKTTCFWVFLIVIQSELDFFFSFVQPKVTPINRVGRVDIYSLFVDEHGGLKFLTKWYWKTSQLELIKGEKMNLNFF